MGHGKKKDGERKKRNPNFTSDEVEILSKEVKSRESVLFGELKGPHLTQAIRDRAWAVVAEKVNAVAPVIRTIHDLKNKFADLKTRTKKKANARFREAMKTGGGKNTAPNLTKSEEMLCSFIGKESIEGINTKFDIGVSLPSTSSVLTPAEEEIQNAVTNVVLIAPPSPFKNLTAFSDILCDDQDQELSPDIPKKNTTSRQKLTDVPVAINNKPDKSYEELLPIVTPKQRTTLKQKLISVSVATNDKLDNIYKELQAMNETLKRRLEIEDEINETLKRKLTIEEEMLQLKKLIKTK